MPTVFERLDTDADGIASVVELMRSLYEHDAIAFDAVAARAALTGLVRDPRNGAAWLVKDGDDNVGYAIVTFGYSLEFHGVDAFLDELYIAGPYRGRGLGRRAVELAEDLCRERGVRALHLEVERTNMDAQAVYRKMGFRDHDRYLLTKWISR